MRAKMAMLKQRESLEEVKLGMKGGNTTPTGKEAAVSLAGKSAKVDGDNLAKAAIEQHSSEVVNLEKQLAAEQKVESSADSGDKTMTADELMATSAKVDKIKAKLEKAKQDTLLAEAQLNDVQRKQHNVAEALVAGEKVTEEFAQSAAAAKAQAGQIHPIQDAQLSTSTHLLRRPL